MIRNLIANSTRPLPHRPPSEVFTAAPVCAVIFLGVTVLSLVGCRVQVNKGADGKDKNVQVETPFGGVHVNTDQTTASDLGLPVYPGAQIVTDKDNDKSADVHLGFGEWELRVKAVNYATPDSQDQVSTFYKKALASYGTVISCRNEKPVGSPTITSEGLTCADDSAKAKVNVNESDSDGLELKAGSKRHQHIVGFESPKDGKTRFALVELALPAGVESAGKSD